MRILPKDNFVEFVAQFKSLPWKLRQEILSDYEGCSPVEGMKRLYDDLMSDAVNADDWKALYKTLQIIENAE